MLAIVVVLVGVQAPAVLLASFVPMFLIASAFYYMNRADPDCGTSFSWVTRALGPSLGWVGGWAICTTGIIVIGSLADVGAFYIFDILSLDSLRDDKTAVTIFAIVIIAAMTVICVLGTELSAHFQRFMIGAQVLAMLIFAAVAIVKVAAGDAGSASVDPELSWFSPFAVDSLNVLVLGLLTGVFIYWGWESAVNLNEETEDSTSAPGLAAVVSTVILLVTYVATTVAIVAFAGPKQVAEYEDDTALFGAIADQVLGSELSWIVVLAIITSAIASTQTTILPASRTSLSMARQGAFPAAFGKVHPRYLTPHISTITIGAIAAIWYGVLNSVSQNFLFDSLTALSLMIAFYYAADRPRVRGLLPPRADQVGEELPLHRCRAAHRVGDPGVSVLQGDRRVLEGGRFVQRHAGLRDRHPGRARSGPAAPGRGADAGLAPHRPRRLLRPAPGDRRSGGGRGHKIGVAAVPEEAV